jgi:hypothetical protein
MSSDIGRLCFLRAEWCIVVRDSAFGSPDERRRRFIELVQGYVALAGVEDKAPVQG